jgi:hypothetical protein
MSTTGAGVGRTRAAAVVLAAVAVVVGACGSSSSTGGITSEPASKIVSQSRAATAGSPSAQVLGLVTTGGQTIHVDIRYAKGVGGAGTLVAGGQVLSVRLVGQGLYMQASQTLLSSLFGAAATRIPEGVWLKLPSGNEGNANFVALSSSLYSVASLGSLLDQLFSSSAKWVKGPQSSINKQPVIAVTDSTSGQGGTLYIATTGPAYLIRAGGGAKNGSEQLNFGAYGEPVSIEAPPNPVDVSQLNGS